ncbi:ObirObp2 [Ooceraea biroi]|uniref:ObirObp2 n=1 Tax=Ooceraea biroi TaxID=2015173 RepID=A0A3L8DQ01_OOCBI|nr:uncharacterized protein LOC105287262 [Ooceraea biroi]RLU22477.1 ObirObp2 [Ooceraea biroi]
MKRLALFVLALAAAVNADYDADLDVKDVNDLAGRFETDVATIKGCLDEAGTTIVELVEARKKWKNMQDTDEIDEETKAVFLKHNTFIACMLEKKEMMKDSKLVLDKILEVLQNDKDLKNPPTKEVLTECVTTLNENSEMSREDRAVGLVLCVSSEEDER